jgi:hypothetical protein
MRAFREANPLCSWSGKPVKEVHHILPVSVAPELAAEPGNMLGMADRSEHYVLGHNNRSWQSFNRGLLAVLGAQEAIQTLPPEEMVRDITRDRNPVRRLPHIFHFMGTIGGVLLRSLWGPSEKDHAP